MTQLLDGYMSVYYHFTSTAHCVQWRFLMCCPYYYFVHFPIWCCGHSCHQLEWKGKEAGLLIVPVHFYKVDSLVEYILNTVLWFFRITASQQLPAGWSLNWFSVGNRFYNHNGDSNGASSVNGLRQYMKRVILSKFNYVWTFHICFLAAECNGVIVPH